MNFNLKASRSGQVVVEYILMITVIVSVIMGVFWSVLDKQVNQMKTNLQDELQQVISQNEIGIPVAWFGLDRPATENVRFQPGGSGEEADGDPGQEEEEDDEENDKTGDAGDGAGPNAPGLSSSPPSGGGRKGRASPPSPPSNPPPRSSAGGGSAPDGEQAGRQAQRARNDSSDGDPKVSVKGDEAELGGGVSSDRQPPKEGADGEGAKDGGKKAGGGESIANQGQRFLFGRGAEAEGGDCEDIDMFTLLKLGAVVAIILLLFAVMVTAKGQKGD
ncbi:hypothetical protein GW915_01075 [bacterium]|nr:hypothetical protein [bacterium]